MSERRRAGGYSDLPMATGTLTRQQVESALRKHRWIEANGKGHKKWTPPSGLKEGQLPLILSHGAKSNGERLTDVTLNNLEAFGAAGKAVIATLQKGQTNGRGRPRSVVGLPQLSPQPATGDQPKGVDPAPPNVDKRFGVDVGGGLRAAVVFITPTIADRWLRYQPGPNRTLLDGRMARYSGDMTENRWNLNGETIVFDWDNQLADGQHRLAGCVKANVNITTLVVWGVEPLKAQRTMDTGATRSLRDLIRMAGGQYDVQLASATANAYKLRKLGLWDQSDAGRGTPQQLIEFLCDNWILYTTDPITYTGGEDRAKQLFAREPDICRMAGVLNNKLPIGAAMYMTTHWLFFAHTDATTEEIGRFFESLTEGCDFVDGMRMAFEPTDPRALLAKMIMNRRDNGGWSSWPTIRRYAYFIKAWNLWRNGITRSQLSWRPSLNEPFPRPV